MAWGLCVNASLRAMYMKNALRDILPELSANFNIPGGIEGRSLSWVWAKPTWVWGKAPTCHELTRGRSPSVTEVCAHARCLC